MVHNESFLLYNLYNTFGAVKPHFFANNIIIFVIIGIVNVCNGEAKELPLINKFKFIKK